MKKPSSEVSTLRLIKWCTQWQDKKNWEKVPVNLRGIYVLHNGDPKEDIYNVVYIGMAASGMGIKRRLRNHYRSKRKGDKWTHFSFYVVWENIRDDEIRELECLLQEIYRKDTHANSLAQQKGCQRIKDIREKDPKKWPSGD
jgi:hypothetical protein